MHKDDVKFPNFSQNAANFPNSMGPCPIPKKGKWGFQLGRNKNKIIFSFDLW